MSKINKHKINLNYMKKTEARSPLIHYKMYASVKFGINHKLVLLSEANFYDPQFRTHNLVLLSAAKRTRTPEAQFGRGAIRARRNSGEAQFGN
jgi:hypothetical protein